MWKPDILKILQLDASICITNKEITNGRVNVTGRVDLKILYIPDGDREKVKSIITSFDFYAKCGQQKYNRRYDCNYNGKRG